MSPVKFLPFALLGLLSTQSMAASSVLLAEDGIQIKIAGSFGRLISLPSDRSTCDPEVIRQNLNIINQSGIIQGVNLTLTKTSNGSCYGPCVDDIKSAMELHCEKGELLSHLVEHLGSNTKE